MYEDAGRWGYLFQSYVLLTMMELHHKEAVRPLTPLSLAWFSCVHLYSREGTVHAHHLAGLSCHHAGEKRVQCAILFCGESS